MRGITSYILSSGFTQPLTFAFQTRKGDLGLLQVIRYTLEPLGVRVRYKLVQPSAALAVPSPSAVAEEKASQGASAINPAAELKALQGEWKMVRIEKGKDADVSWPRIYRGSPSIPQPRLDFILGDRTAVRTCSSDVSIPMAGHRGLVGISHTTSTQP